MRGFGMEEAERCGDVLVFLRGLRAWALVMSLI